MPGRGAVQAQQPHAGPQADAEDDRVDPSDGQTSPAHRSARHDAPVLDEMIEVLEGLGIPVVLLAPPSRGTRDGGLPGRGPRI